MRQAISAFHVELRRTLPTTPERVFRAWTDPAELQHWFGPAGIHAIRIELDLRLGGAFRFEMRDEHLHGEFAITGEFLEIIPAKRLAFSWIIEIPGQQKCLTRVSLSLRPVGGATVLQLRHELLPSQEMAARQREFLDCCLDQLGTLLR